ncbi:ankyrin unc44 [Colletotrichum asianum]
MEALGAAAAIAQFVELSLKAGKLAHSVVSSFQHAPAEITELSLKLQSLHGLLIQVAALSDELPETQTQPPLLPKHHLRMFSMGMENISDSLMRLESIITVSAGSSHGVRDRLRWAMLDKKKAQTILRDAQMVNDELSIMLQILTIRLSSMSHKSLAIGQSLMREETKQSLDDMKAFLSTTMTHLMVRTRPAKFEEGAISRRATVRSISHKGPDVDSPSAQPEYRNDPAFMLMQHNRRVTRRHLVATFGNTKPPEISADSFYTIGATLTMESRMKSRKAKAMFNLCFKLLGQYLLRIEIQAQLRCRPWKLDPLLAASLTIVNVRPRDTPIFLACRDWDLQEVHYLLETGQASIHDADEEVGGLLEHVISGKRVQISRVIEEDHFLRGGQAVLEYLLDRGCDPSTSHLAENKLPPVLSAFSEGYRDATMAMLSRGADLLSFGSKPGGLLDQFGANTSQLLWKFRLLSSIGYSDWQLDEPSDNLLYGGCQANQLDVVLFALEIAGINPDQHGALGRTPMSNAASTEWIEGITALRQYGACVNVSEGSWNGTPLRRSLQSNQVLTNTSHYLLLQGIDPRLKSFNGLSGWGEMMTTQYSPATGWYLQFPYISLEGSIAHLLHHGSDPFEVFGSDFKTSDHSWPGRPRWFDLMGHIQASDIARFWSYGLSKTKDTWTYYCPDDSLEDFVEKVGTMDRQRDFDWTFQYNIEGHITWNYASSTSSEVSGETEVSSVTSLASSSHEAQGEGFSQDAYHEGEVSEYESDTSYLADGDFVPIWEHTDQEIRGRAHTYLDLSPDFFENATHFHHHTATLQGRRQLSRWPMVRALCDGLQHAGYRVEMDDDGDLWFECDDGDRYFDAWETQPAEDRDDWLVDVCPICQNFDDYGLGNVLDIEYEAIEKVQEYRRQVQEGKRRYF